MAERGTENRSSVLVATAAAATHVLRFTVSDSGSCASSHARGWVSTGGGRRGDLCDQVLLSLSLREPDASRGSSHPRQLHISRHTERLDELVRFYRDGLGLTEIGGLQNHNGYDVLLLKVPGGGAHLELTAGGEHGPPRRIRNHCWCSTSMIRTG